MRKGQIRPCDNLYDQMASIAFDTHRVVKDLQDAGFDETQAEAVVKALGETIDRDVVRPEDLKDFATKQDIADLRTEMAALELRLTIRLTSAMIAVVGIAVAILKLFP